MKALFYARVADSFQQRNSLIHKMNEGMIRQNVSFVETPFSSKM